MRYKQKQSGFSAVELLITLFIAAVFLMTGFQLYAVIIKNGGDARQQSSAANIATDYLQQYESSATSPCTPGPLLTGQAVTGAGLSNATVTVTITCPNISSPTFSTTGGTISYNGGYTTHIFSGAGTYTFTSNGTKNLEVLAVAGGGGGGRAETNNGGDGGGGGGAGGVIYTASYGVSGTGTTTTVTVGGGGGGSTTGTYPTIPKGANGGNSVFGSLTATGGGGGGSDNDAGTGLNMGAVGGSGGGAANAYNQATAAASGISGQGYTGGDAVSSPTVNRAGSGGGGAGSIGVSRTSQAGGAGGAGATYSISSTSTVYAGGGGGGVIGNQSASGGAGGSGVGGTGGTSNGNGGNATANTGSGGGGGGSSSGLGGNGSSGIVIVRYPTPVATTLTNVSKVVATVTYGDSKTVSNSTYVSTVGIVTKGLALNLDAGSTASYPGSGPTWTDLSPNGINGTLVGGVTYSNSNGGTLVFNGTSGYVNIGNNANLNTGNSFTIGAWIKPSSLASRVGIYSTRNSNLAGCYMLEVGIGNGGVNRAAVTGVGIWHAETPDNTISVNNWQYLVYTENSTGQYLYVNGVSITITTTGYNIIDNTDPKLIGAGTTGGQYFAGSMGVVQYYNRALSALEVQQNYTALKGRYGL